MADAAIMYISNVEPAHPLKYSTHTVNLVGKTSPIRPLATVTFPGTQIDLSKCLRLILFFLFNIGSALFSIFCAFVSGLILLSLCCLHAINCWFHKRLAQPEESQRAMIQGNSNVFSFHAEKARKNIGSMNRVFQESQIDTTNDAIRGIACYIERVDGRARAAKRRVEVILKNLDLSRMPEEGEEAHKADQLLLLAYENKFTKHEEVSKTGREDAAKSQHVEDVHIRDELSKMRSEISQLASAMMRIQTQIWDSKAVLVCQGNMGGDVDSSQVKTMENPTPTTYQSLPLLDSTATRVPTPTTSQSSTLQELTAASYRKDVYFGGCSQSCDADTLSIAPENDVAEDTSFIAKHSSIYRLHVLEAPHESSTVVKASPTAFDRSQSIPALPSGNDLLSASPHWLQVSLSESGSEPIYIEGNLVSRYLHDSLLSPARPSIHERIFKIRRKDPTPPPSPSYDDMSSIGEFSQFQPFLPDPISPSPSNFCTPPSDPIARVANRSFVRFHESFRPLSSSWLKPKPSKPADDQEVESEANQYLRVPRVNHDYLVRHSPSFANLSQALPALPSNDYLLAAHDSSSLSPFAVKLIQQSQAGCSGNHQHRGLPAKVSDLFNPI